MKTERYFFNVDTEELIILTQDVDESDVVKFQQIVALEYEDEDPDEEPEENLDELVKKGKVGILSDVRMGKRPILLGRTKKEKPAGGGLTDESWRHNRRVTKKQREQVKELLARGFNSQRISDEIEEDLEFTNEIIDRVRGEDMDAKVTDDKDRVSL